MDAHAYPWNCDSSCTMFVTLNVWSQATGRLVRKQRLTENSLARKYQEFLDREAELMRSSSEGDHLGMTEETFEQWKLASSCPDSIFVGATSFLCRCFIYLGDPPNGLTILRFLFKFATLRTGTSEPRPNATLRDYAISQDQSVGLEGKEYLSNMARYVDLMILAHNKILRPYYFFLSSDMM